MALKKKSNYPTAAGVLTIIAACICLSSGIIYAWATNFPVFGIFGFLGFAFGLISGILALKRKVFSLVEIGVAIVMVEAILSIFSFEEHVIGIIFGVPVLVLTILSMMFTEMSKREFGFEIIPKGKHTELGEVSLVFGIISVLPIFPITLLFGPLALISGAISYLGERKDSYGLAGIILGLISTIISIVIWVLLGLIIW